jgi:hypothetical protein
MRFLAMLIALLSLWAGPPPAHAQDDSEESRQALRLGETFARGFYLGDPAMVLSVVHPALSKLGIWPNIRNSGRDGLLSLPPGTLDIFATSHNADGHIDPATAVTQVEVLDAAEGVSVFRLIAARDWFDYHLATQIGNRWLIVNCVFGGLPDLEAPVTDVDLADVSTAVVAYAAAVSADDYEQLANAVHLDFTRRSVRTRDPERLIVETRETLAQDMHGRARRGETNVSVLAVSRVTAAARIDGQGRREWVFLLRLNGRWRPVNSFVARHQ